MWQGLSSNKNNNNNMFKCQLEFIIVHYSFSYCALFDTHTHNVRRHTHTDNSLLCALSSQSASPRSLSLPKWSRRSSNNNKTVRARTEAAAAAESSA